MAGLVGPMPMGLGGFTPVPVLEQFRVMSMSFLLDRPDAPTIWRGPLKGGVIRRFVADVDWGALDYLVVDLPPGTGDEPLTVAQMFPDADGGVVVTTPQEASVAVCRKAVNFLKAVKTPCLGIIENMSGFVCPHCGEETAVFSTGGGEQMAVEMGVPFLGRLPLAPEVVSCVMRGGHCRAQPLIRCAALWPRSLIPSWTGRREPRQIPAVRWAYSARSNCAPTQRGAQLLSDCLRIVIGPTLLAVEADGQRPFAFLYPI